MRVEKKSKSLITPPTTPTSDSDPNLSSFESHTTKNETSSTLNETSHHSSSKRSTKKIARLFNYLQYVNVKIGAALIVLLDDVPDCLIHVTIEG